MWEIQVIECGLCQKRLYPRRRKKRMEWEFWTDFDDLRGAIRYGRKSILAFKTCDCHFRIYNTETQEAIPFELFG